MNKDYKLDISDFWDFISSNQILDEQFIFKYFESLNWDHLCEFQKLSDKTLTVLNKYVVWFWVCKQQKLSEKYIEHFIKGDIYWNFIFNNQNYSDHFLMKHLDKIENWFDFKPRIKKKIPIEFIDYAVKNKKEIDWSYFLQHKKLNAKTIKKYKDIINTVHFDPLDYSEKELSRLISYGIEIKDLYSSKQLSDNFLREHLDDVNWDILSRTNNFSIEFIREYQDKINWHEYSKREIIPYEIFEEFQDKIIWNGISIYNHCIDKRFVKRFGHKLEPWNIICNNFNKIDEDYLDSLYPNLDADEKERLYSLHPLSEQFVEKHLKGKREWKRYAADVRSLSEEFIRKHADKLDWHTLCSTQKLSERLMEDYIDRLDWLEVSINQKLSEKFIRKHQDKVVWGEILLNQKLSMNMLYELANIFTIEE